MAIPVVALRGEPRESGAAAEARICRFAPDFAEEIESIADGAGLERHRLFVLNARSEVCLNFVYAPGVLDGVPVHALLRDLLHQRDLESARQRLDAASTDLAEHAFAHTNRVDHERSSGAPDLAPGRSHDRSSREDRAWPRKLQQRNRHGTRRSPQA